MAGTTIDGLNSVTSLTAQDEVPVWDAEASGEPTKKITASNLAASVKTLGSLVNTTEMNNALAGKQNTLTFDTTPTTGSTNPVTSGGTADAISQSTASSYVIWGSQGNSSGYLRLARCGKVRLLSLEDVVIPSGANFIIDTLPEGDRPGFLTVSSLYAGGSAASIWVRTAGTFGTSGTAGHTINGQIVWFAV